MIHSLEIIRREVKNIRCRKPHIHAVLRFIPKADLVCINLKNTFLPVGLMRELSAQLFEPLVSNHLWPRENFETLPRRHRLGAKTNQSFCAVQVAVVIGGNVL